MGRPRTFDMSEAVETATVLFWRGFDETSLTDLTTALGVGPASFYFAFGSKEALFRRCVDGYLAEREAAFAAAFLAPTVHSAVKMLLRGYVDVVTDPSHAPGCLIVNSSPVATGPNGLRQWLASHRQQLWAKLEQLLSRDAAAHPTAMARLVTTLAGGLAIEASSGATRDELYDAVAIAMNAFPSIGGVRRAADGQ